MSRAWWRLSIGLLGIAFLLISSVSARGWSEVSILVRHLSPVGANLASGLRFGIDEAAHTAMLLGRSVTFTDVASTRLVHGVVTTKEDSVWVSPGSDESCRFAVSVRHDRASSALDSWRAENRVTAQRALRIAEWHPSLRRYGAAQLNERFERATGGEMSAEAWVGWVAVKALVEAALREKPNERRCDALARLSLDGHKGQPLKFDPVTRELRQPLYVVADDEVLGQIDVR